MAVRDLAPPDEDYRSINRRGWDRLSGLGIESSTAWDVTAMTDPQGWLDGFRWLPWPEIRDVLVLGGGGGQQAPLFAWLGRRVTVVDLSPAQLERDRAAAEALGVDLECVEGNMCDLSELRERRYDLVYQPVSTCYVPDVRNAYREVASVLRAGGRYWSEHWNPVQIQASGSQAWDGSAYRIDRPATDSTPRVLGGPGSATGPECWYYVHTLGDLIGGICDAGFVIERFAEHGTVDITAAPGTNAHMGAFFAPFYVVLACRQEDRP